MRLPKTTRSMLGLALAGGMLLLIGPAFGNGDPPCDPVSGDGEAAVDNEPGVFEGFGLLVIRGETFDVDTRVTGGLPWFGDDGTMHVATSHTFTYVDENGDESVLTTADDALLEPIPDGAPGEHRLNSNMEIDSGTGIFAGVSGRLHGHGIIDMFDEVNNIAFPFFGEASYDINGVICDKGRKDQD